MKIARTERILTLYVLTISLVSGCFDNSLDGGNNGKIISSVEITPEYLKMATGDTAKLNVEVRSADGSIVESQAVQWGVEDTTILLVEDDGLVHARKEGKTNVRAIVQDVYDEISIEVHDFLGRAILENQTEHSGILVRLVELDTVVFTDSSGYFYFEEVPDGVWTLKAKYPYFSSAEETIIVKDSVLETVIDIQLKQQLQFWVEPAETTISISEATLDYNPSAFLFEMRGYLTNITDSVVVVRGVLTPRTLFSIKPTNVSWPIVENIDNRNNYCYEQYEWFGATDAIDLFEFIFDPDETWMKHRGKFCKNPVFCQVYIRCFLRSPTNGITPSTLTRLTFGMRTILLLGKSIIQ